MNYVKLILLGMVTLIAAMAANWAHDLAYQVHALLIMVVAFGMFIWVLRHTDEDIVTPNQDGLRLAVTPLSRRRCMSFSALAASVFGAATRLGSSFGATNCSSFLRQPATFLVQRSRKNTQSLNGT